MDRMLEFKHGGPGSLGPGSLLGREEYEVAFQLFWGY